MAMLGKTKKEDALLESEERYRSLVEFSPDAIIIQCDTVIVYSNPAGAKLFRLDSVDQVIGKRILDFVPEEKRELADQQLRCIVSDGTAPTRNEVVAVAQDGHVSHLEVLAIPITYKGQQAIQFAIRDVTAHRLAEEQLHEYGERLKSLSQQLMKAQENERRAIARELHDEVGQSLTTLKLRMQSMQRKADSDDLHGEIDQAISTTDQILENIRSLSLDLRPSILDDLGLVAALDWYVDKQSKSSDLSIQFIHGDIKRDLAPELEIACFRIAQEAITNVMRHARAKVAIVELHQRSEELLLSIRDDGMGFNPNVARADAIHGKSLGILGMQERAENVSGHMEIHSDSSSGTEIYATFPLACGLGSGPKQETQ